jgi:outer membrane protein assembly factor BamB
LAVAGQSVYVLDRGRLYRGEFPGQDGGVLHLADAMPPGNRAGGWPIQELAYVTTSGTGVYAMDKALNLFHFAPDAGWRLTRAADDYVQDPGPMYTAVTTYSGQVYLLDPNQNQVWRMDSPTSLVRLLEQVIPWDFDTERLPDVRKGIALEVGREGIFVLTWDGRVLRLQQRRAAPGFLPQWSAAGAVAPSTLRPRALYQPPDDPNRLYVVDVGANRVVVLSAESGKYLGAYRVPTDLGAASAVAVVDGRLHVLAGSTLLVYPVSGGLAPLE